ncbi:caspase-9-like isoform X5 [Oncorhynchus kisutch]|uniref:caspase-9-like isoform X5 n=1 Tax=Oncorhynchus kisutch TaxID=8019 RepID=UPI0009A06D56|nr:caspase-9-like isoform X5 [Oncorhynchus kisutch]
MEERHKRILQRNRVNLVRDLNPSDMYHGLLSKGIFTQDMIDEIKSSGIRQGQARQLVRDLETRGSLAFPALIECLHETGQHSLAELLLDGEPQNQPLPQPVHVRPVVRPLPVSPEREFGKPRATGRVRRDSIQVHHEVSEYTANGLYKQMPGSFNFLRKLLYFQALPCQRPIVS